MAPSFSIASWRRRTQTVAEVVKTFGTESPSSLAVPKHRFLTSRRRRLALAPRGRELRLAGREQLKLLTSSTTVTAFLVAFTVLLPQANLQAQEKPAFVDYCARLEQEIQGRKHGFLAGNVTYYVGGFHASWKLVEHETLGLTHPFHHDLRSRGVGLLESELHGPENTGTGNDYSGWEIYKDTRVLYGSVIIDGVVNKHPKPTSMRWRPDRMICEYEVAGVRLKEVKFIAASDAAISFITSSKPVQLQFSGNSFNHRNSVSSSAKIEFDAGENAILIAEGGQVRSRPDPNGEERVGPCVYNDMTTVLSASRPIHAPKLNEDEKGVQHYQLTVPCDESGTAVCWFMHDERKAALRVTHGALREHEGFLRLKTAEVNRELNEEIPWFRCSDEKFVDIYYYLWSLYLMYYIDVGRGWEAEPHTQTAVNNFLGMHRYDACFQNKVGAWTSDKQRYAYGNVLTWKHLTQAGHFRETPNGVRMLSDNKGQAWHSGAYGPEMSEHVLGAWQIYQHTGDLEFLRNCYEGHFQRLFWRHPSGFAMNQFEVVATLEGTASLLGLTDDVSHWQELIRRDEKHIRQMFDQRWEANSVENYFAAPKNGMLMTNAFWAMRSRHFPREYAERMVESWAMNSEQGFLGEFFPTTMAKRSMQEFDTKVDHAFGYTPDTAYFTLDGMFRQGLKRQASQLTLNHLDRYNFHDEWQIPVAPEAYRRDLKLFGDQYSNFNAGKILLYLEGLAGLKYSLPDQQLHINPALPEAWEWMEVRLPIDGKWTTIRYSNEGVEARGCPLNVVIEVQ